MSTKTKTQFNKLFNFFDGIEFDVKTREEAYLTNVMIGLQKQVEASNEAVHLEDKRNTEDFNTGSFTYTLLNNKTLTVLESDFYDENEGRFWSCNLDQTFPDKPNIVKMVKSILESKSIIIFTDGYFPF